MAYNQKPDTADDVLMRPANCTWSTVALRVLPQWWRTTDVNSSVGLVFVVLFFVCLFVFVQVKKHQCRPSQDSCPSMLSAPLCLSVCLFHSLTQSRTRAYFSVKSVVLWHGCLEVIQCHDNFFLLPFHWHWQRSNSLSSHSFVIACGRIPRTQKTRLPLLRIQGYQVKAFLHSFFCQEFYSSDFCALIHSASFTRVR